MGKKKSAFLLVLYTLLLALLCFVCTVSFSYGDNGLYTFSSILDLTEKDADLGGTYGANSTYNGGGYSTVYYPEGVISAKEYNDNLGGITEESERTEYEESYRPYADGTLYLEVGVACDAEGVVLQTFQSAFSAAAENMTERVEALRQDGARVSVRDGYTLEVFLPAMMDSEYYAFSRFALTGELSLKFGSDESSATDAFAIKTGETIRDYVASVSFGTRSGTSYVAFAFTQRGAEVLENATADAGSSDSSSTSHDHLYICVGDTTVISLEISEQLTGGSLYISGSYTSETARTTAILLDSALSGTQSDLALTAGDAYQIPASYGASALTMLYISFGVIFAAMMVFFFVRYRLMAFVHLYTYLLFLFGTILCVWAIPFLYLSTEVYIAFLFSSLLLSASNVMTFEAARREYALGKTYASSVKTGYKKCLWKLFDLHIVLALFAFVAYFIALPGLQAAAFVLGLTVVFSGVCTLIINRFVWAMMAALSKKQGAFSHYRREETDDE